MHTSTAFSLRMALVGSLAILGVASTAVAHAQASTTTADQAVTIDVFAFGPAEVSVPVGATVGWTNVQDGVKHTATSLDGVWDSGVLSTSDAFSFTFNQAGDFAYQCDIHPSMRGVIHVAATPQASQAAAVAAATPAATAVTLNVPTPAPATPTQSVAVPTAKPTPAPASYYGY